MKNEKFFYDVAKANQELTGMQLGPLIDESMSSKDKHYTWLRFMGLIETWYTKEKHENYPTKRKAWKA